MGVLSGNAISGSDLTALANIANANSLLSSSLPIYGQCYSFSNFTITNGGSGYLLNDILSDGLGGQYQVMQVSTIGGSSGSITGIQPISPYYYYTSNGMPPAWVITGGAGSGASIAYQYGPLLDVTSSAAYGFPQYPYSQGNITSLYLIDGGLNYSINEEISLIGLPFNNIKVTGINPNGVITSFSGSFPINNYTVPSNINYLTPNSSSATGSHCIFGGYFTLNPPIKWLTELNRLITNISTTVGSTGFGGNTFGISPKDVCVSGPNPTYGPTDNYTNTNFYYSNAAGTASITCSSVAAAFGYNSFAVDVIPTLNGAYTLVTQSYTDSVTTTFLIGGSSSVYVSGSFYSDWIIQGGFTITGMYGGLTQSYLSTGSCAGNLSIINSNVPGTPFKYVNSYAFGSTVVIGYSIDQFVAPGSYSMTIVSNTGPSNADYINIDMYGNVNGLCNTRVYSDIGAGGAGNGPLVSSYFYTNPIACDGIDHNFQPYKIPIPFDPITGMPGGIGYYQNECLNDPYDPPYPAPVFSPPWSSLAPASWGTSCTGSWSAMTQPVTQLNQMPYNQMPWNLIRHFVKGPNGNQTLVAYNPMLSQSNAFNTMTPFNTSNPVEKQMQLPSWTSGVWMPQGQVIQDNNHCIQQCISSGWTGNIPPTWSVANNGITMDTNSASNAQWQNIQNYNFGATTWQSGHYYNIGDTVIDTMGCLRTNVVWNVSQSYGGSSSNVCPFVRYSSSINPNLQFPQLIADTTQSISYSASFIFSGSNNTNLWSLTQVTNSRLVIPAVDRQGGMPSYPQYWLSETNAFFKPPVSMSQGNTIFGAGNQWFDSTYNYASINTTEHGFGQSNLCLGYLLTRILGQRIGNNVTNSIILPTQNSSGSFQQINFNIGCMRNGSFTSFSNPSGSTSYSTGQLYSVLIPIFSTDALVYSCAEKIDLQVIATSVPSVGFGSTIPTGYPQLASFINDNEALIGLIT